jgi:hypothetical protein
MVSSATAHAEEAISAISWAMDPQADSDDVRLRLGIAQVRALVAIAFAVDLLAEAVREGFPGPQEPLH